MRKIILGTLGFLAAYVVSRVVTDCKKYDRELVNRMVVNLRKDDEKEIIHKFMANSFKTNNIKQKEKSLVSAHNALSKTKMNYDGRKSRIEDEYNAAVNDLKKSIDYDNRYAQIKEDAIMKVSNWKEDNEYNSKITSIDKQIAVANDNYDKIKRQLKWIENPASKETYEAAKKAAKKVRNDTIKELENSKKELNKSLKDFEAMVERDRSDKAYKLNSELSNGVTKASSKKNEAINALDKEYSNFCSDNIQKVIEARTEEERAILEENNDVTIAYNRLMTKEQDVFNIVMSNLSYPQRIANYLTINKVPRIIVIISACIPVVIAGFLGIKYVRFVSDTLRYMTLYSKEVIV